MDKVRTFSNLTFFERRSTDGVTGELGIRTKLRDSDFVNSTTKFFSPQPRLFRCWLLVWLAGAQPREWMMVSLLPNLVKSN
jgi:hypothetical protein